MRLSTRDDARLTAEERAALSSLEALAAADDPQLASRLRGPRRWSIALHGARMKGLSAWAGLPAWIHTLWFAVPVVLFGLVLVVAGLTLGWGIGVLGALVSTGGLVLVVRHAGRRLGPGLGG